MRRPCRPVIEGRLDPAAGARTEKRTDVVRPPGPAPGSTRCCCSRWCSPLVALGTPWSGRTPATSEDLPAPTRRRTKKQPSTSL